MTTSVLSRRTFLSGGLGVTVGALCASAETSKPSQAAALEQIAAEAIAKHATPGLAIAIMKGGTLLWERGFGLANLETRTAVTPQTVFRIGSLTKQFTAAAALKLSAMGKLDLRAPVSAVLPVFRTLKPFSTLELLHQTAGLHSEESDVTSAVPIKPLSQVGLAEALAQQSKPFDFEPGTAWMYSNANYIVLGAIIEQLSGLPLSQAMKKLLFDPLGLRSLAFDTPDEVVPDRASGYSQTGDVNRPYVHASYLDPSQAGGAGAMRARVSELCLWHHMLQNGNLLDRKHLDLMRKPGVLRDGRPSSANRFLPADANYGDTAYACGLLVTGPSDPNPSILHYGAIFGFCAVLQTYLRHGLSFAVVCNGDIGPSAPFRSIRKAVLASFLT